MPKLPEPMLTKISNDIWHHWATQSANDRTRFICNVFSYWSRTCRDLASMGLVKVLRWRHNGRECVSNHQPYHCLLNRWCRSKKTSTSRVTGLCAGNSLVTDEFPAQMTSNAEDASILWRHRRRDVALPRCTYTVDVGKLIQNMVTKSIYLLIKYSCWNFSSYGSSQSVYPIFTSIN